MPIHQVVILAVVQALTEFLPVSSTAHLALVPWLLNWRDPGLTFNVALHLGTLVAVLVYFWRLWVRIVFAGLGLKPPVEPARGPARRTGLLDGAPAEDDEAVADRRLLWLLALGTIPAAVVGYSLEHHVRTTLRSPYVMAASLILVAFLMAYGERVARQLHGLKDLGLSDTLLVGLAQALALIPGVSRSGITITAALLRHYRRDSSARFSFLLATPVIAGAVVKESVGLWSTGVPDQMRLPFLLGIAVAALVGYAVIAFFIRYLQTRTLKIFIYYRVVFGLMILVLAIFSSAP